MANSNKPNLSELVLDAFATHGQLNGTDLMARTGIADGQQMLAVVQQGIADGWIGRNGDMLGLTPAGVTMYQEWAAAREAQAQPAPAAETPLAGAFGIAPEQQPVQTGSIAPAQGTGKKGGKKPTASKTEAQPLSQAVAQPAEDRIVEYTRLDYLTPEELEFGIAVGTDTAKEYVKVGGPENLEVAKLIMRSVSKYTARLARNKRKAA